MEKDINQKLAESIVSYIQSRRDKKAESFYKDKPKKNKKGVISNGAFNHRLSAIIQQSFLNEEQKENFQEIEKSKKSKEQTPLEFQVQKFQKLMDLVLNDDVKELNNERLDFLSTNEEEFDSVSWLSQWCGNAKDISFATHVAKLTHSSSKGSSILDTTVEKNDRYITTNALQSPELDTASSNAASLPIADILKVSVGGTTVLDQLKKGNKQFFYHITKDSDTIEKWCDQLKQAYDSTQKQSYFLSKQVYFPTKNKGEYHLLLPLTSSSLVHALHLEHKKRFDDENMKSAIELKRNKKYSPIPTVSYPNSAVLNVTASNHSNASSLNGKRGGRIKLFPAEPPKWKSNDLSVNGKKDIFDKALFYQLKEHIEDLQKYLSFVQDRQWSLSEPKRHAITIQKLDDLIDDFFNYIQILSLNDQNDLDNILLPLDQQTLLGLNQSVDNTSNKDWQESISSRFAYWLNNQLKKNEKLNLTPIHARFWKDYFSFQLREFIAVQEVSV
jgi:CRISPR-associated protein Csy1